MSKINLPEDGSVEYDSYYVNVQAATFKAACDVLRPTLAAKGLTAEQTAFVLHERSDCETQQGTITCTWGKPTATKDGWLFEIDRNLIADLHPKLIAEAMPVKTRIVKRTETASLFDAEAIEMGVR